MIPAPTRRLRRLARRPRFARMTDGEIMAALTEIAPERFDPVLRAAFERATRDGGHITVYEVSGLVESPGLSPMIVISHVSERPSMRSIRAAYGNMRWRCAGESA